MRIAPMIRRRTRQNQTSRFRWDRWADALPLGFAYADRFTCPRLPVAILRLRHKGCTAMKKALYGIVAQRLTDDLWSTTSHELDPPMAIRSTGICPIHLVLNKRNRSFSRISMTAIAVPMAVAHGNGRPSCSSRRKMASESDGVGFIVPMRMNSAEYAMTSPMSVGISCSHSICARMSVFLAPTCRSPAISRFLGGESSPKKS